MSGGRFYRSTREAFPVERFPALSGPYHRPRLGAALLKAATFVLLLASIGVMFAWRA